MNLLLVREQSKATTSSGDRFQNVALRRYEDGARRIVDMVTGGANDQQDRVWRNTCEWLLSCRIKLYVLSLRHDSVEQIDKAEKAEKRGYDPNLDGAYFGLDKPILPGCEGSAIPAYGQITILPFSQRRFIQPGKIVIVDPSRITDPQELKRVITYEVQLVAAHEQPSADEYRSEFNARWVAGYHNKESEQPDPQSPAFVTVNNRKAAMRNARQAAIFSDIYNQSEGVASAWNHWWTGRAYQRSVYNLAAPQGKNLINSVRIDNLYLALTADPIQLADVDAAVKAVTSSPDDRDAIHNPGAGMVGAWHDILRDAVLPSDKKASIAKALGVYGFAP